MMGSEFGQWNEWHYEHSLDWHLLETRGETARPGLRRSSGGQRLLPGPPELWELDFSWEGFEWIQADDNQANNCAPSSARTRRAITCWWVQLLSRGPDRLPAWGLPGAPYLPVQHRRRALRRTGPGDKAPVTVRMRVPRAGAVPGSGSAPMSAVIYRCIRKSPALKKAAAAKSRRRGENHRPAKRKRRQARGEKK